MYIYPITFAFVKLNAIISRFKKTFINYKTIKMKKLTLSEMEKVEGGVLVCLEPVYSITGVCVGGQPCPPFQVCIM